MEKKSLCGMTAQELKEIIGPAGFSDTHVNSVLNQIYKKSKKDINDLLNIPKELKHLLEEKTIPGFFSPSATEISVDKSIKYLFSASDGRSFETVFIPDDKRTTVCVSTQSGCRMGCPFCVTSSYGFRGNLTAGEIVNQVIALPDAGSVNHVVFMGMGEPMDNLENVLKACEIFTAEWGLSISSRNITVSTVGITDGIRQFLNRSSCNLTLSLHSPFSKERSLLIPAEGAFPFSEIIEMMKCFPRKKMRRFSVAYIMIKGFNDSDLHLEELKKLLAGTGIRVNLLPFHKTTNNPMLTSTPERMQWFKHSLVTSGISASIRKSRGEDISAACGLLAGGIS
jgi:23S rRNA (adenine2503-C2)-methyltransferase